MRAPGRRAPRRRLVIVRLRAWRCGALSTDPQRYIHRRWRTCSMGFCFYSRISSWAKRGPAGSRRRVLLWWVQFALKPATKTLGPHGVFIRRKGLKYLIADSAFKRMQVDALGECRLDGDEHHLSPALRTGGAPNCSEWNDGRQDLRLGHDASLEQAGAQHSLSPVHAGIGR